MANLRNLIDNAVDRHNGGEHMKDFLTQIASAESGGNARAKNSRSTAKGVFQFIDSTWEKYGQGQSVWDAAANTDAAVRLAKDNGKILRGVLGREPTAGEYYLAHFAGAGGAKDVLNASDHTPITNILSAGAISANAPIRLPNGKRFKDFTAKDLRTWAEGKMGADISGKLEYNEQYASGNTSSVQDALEYDKRIKFLIDNGYDEDAARQLSKDEVFGLVFIKILLNMFDASVKVIDEQGRDRSDLSIDNHRAADKAPKAPNLPESVTAAVKDADVVKNLQPQQASEAEEKVPAPVKVAARTDKVAELA